jgi:hypothetical protein
MALAAPAIAIVVLAAVYVFSPNFGPKFDSAQGPYGGDFLQEWIGGHLVASGQADRLYELDFVRQIQHDPAVVGYRWNEDRYFPMVYPPFYYALTSPIALLPMKTAAIVWAALMVVLLVASLLLIGRTAGPCVRNLTSFLPILALFTPLIENLTTNQKGSVLLVLFTVTYALLRGGRPFAAGLVFGLVAFKPQLTLVIAVAMLLKGQWRFVAGGALAGVSLAAVSLAVSQQACLDYFVLSSQMADYLHTVGYDLTKSHCWYGFFHLLLDGQSDSLIRIVSGTMIAATLIAVAVLLRGTLHYDSPRFTLQFAGLAIATVLVSPHLLTYDLTVLILPVAIVGNHLIERRGGNLASALPALLAAVVVLSLSTPIARVTHLQVSVPLMFSALLVMQRWANQERSNPAASSVPARPAGASANDRRSDRRPARN